MIKIDNTFQYHKNLYDKSGNSGVDYKSIIEYISSDKSKIDDSCRLTKISLIEASKKLKEKGLLNEDFSINSKVIDDNGLHNIPEVLRFKELKDKYDSLKSKLPLILCSISTSDGTTSSNNIKSYNNRIVIDIDNLTLQGKSAIEILEKSKTDVYCEFSFISPGGDGVKLFYEIDLNEDLSGSKLIEFHKWVYENISKYVTDFYGVQYDINTSNINRSCLLSRGFACYYNEDKSTLEVYQKWKVESKKSKKISKVVSTSGRSNTSIDHLLNEFISHFDSNPTDLFTDRSEWVKLSYTIVKVKGESGHGIFQKLSSYSVKYNFTACEKLYNNSLKTLNEERLGKYPERWIYKIMTDNGYIPKSTDRVIKNFRWNESDYSIMSDQLKYRVIEDEVTGNFYLQKDSNVEPLIDSNYNQLITDLRLTYNQSLKENILKTYIFSTDNIIKRNFIKEKIESIKFDKSDEFDKVFLHLETEEDIRLVKNILLRWCLGVIQNVYDKYYDEILVLKSKQGLGKTTWIINYLTEPFSDWTTTSFSYDIKSKDDMKLLADKMFIYDTENISMKKADTQIIKKITSTSTLDYRRPYDKFSITKKRIASFIMDTNEDYIFNDVTGGRRFLIVSINNMNIYDKDGGELKKINYEKLWGYIYTLYLNGMRPSDVDIKGIEDTRDSYRLKTDLENIISDIFEESESYDLTFNDIKKYINDYYENNNIKLNTDGYTDTKIGRIVSQRYDKKKVKNNKSTVLKYKVKLRTYKNDDKSELDLFEPSQFIIDDILDRMNLGIKPTESEIETLKKLGR